MEKSNEIGFHVYPILSEKVNLLEWDRFINRIERKYESRVTAKSGVITFDAPGNPSLIRDGNFFREFRAVRNRQSESLILDLFLDLTHAFPGRVFPISAVKYSNCDLEDCTRGRERLISSASTNFSRAGCSDFTFCAYCLNSVPVSEVVRCTACEKRAYCSSKCRENDWDSQGDGQGHSKWCYLGVCEEGVDWNIRPVTGKGLGVVSYTFITKGSRIMVDVPRELTCRAVFDLEPLDGTLIEKDRLNSFATDDESLLFVRVARINHSCDSNACQSFENGTMVISALREIIPGEEITINYTNFNGRTSALDPASARELLVEKWGIVCSDDCKCNNKSFNEKVWACRNLDSAISDMISQNLFSDGLEIVDKLIPLLDEVGATWGWREHVNWSGFLFAVMSDSAMDRALGYGKEAIRIHQAVHHPSSEYVDEMVTAVADPYLFSSNIRIHAAQSA